ncbi:helix-turn-helix transcriptional regulator [Variovorax soli]|uniref:helix-turn-helix transcriptional regulator n=1 Tax=Variovorax soli TaxID=376815 RepID=UPI000A8481B4|nr:AraC family transcriptional regulator [Variovorax soli]
MNQGATHFTPGPRVRLPHVAAATLAPVISATAIAGVSALVRHSFGEKILRQAKQAVMLDIELLEGHECFIPQATMVDFLWEVERRSGEINFGLVVASEQSLSEYGLWGEYLLAAETLGGALGRAVSALRYHSRGDRMHVAVEAGIARVSFFNAMRGRPGYLHVANGTASVILSMLHAYLPPDLRPQWVELDIPRPATTALFEDVYGCPVRFDADAVTLCFDARLLACRSKERPASRLVTIEDVARGLGEADHLDSFQGVLIAQIRAQVVTGTVSIDSTARALDTSVRTLQRMLRRDCGADFRELVNGVRMQRAKELLRSSTASITRIATDFGYSSPANFARAFRKATGLAPHEFRAAC